MNGATFNYPINFDTNWGIDATGWAQAVTNGMLQKAGGSFPLTAEVDFGSSFGLKALHLISETANPSSTGYIRLAKTDTIDWRNNANSADLPLAINGSDQLTFNGMLLATNGGGTVNPGTATHIAYYATNGTALSDASGNTLSGTYIWSGANTWSAVGNFNGGLNVNSGFLNANAGLSVTSGIGLAIGSNIVYNLSAGGTYTLQPADSASDWAYTIPDVGGNDTFAFLDATQTFTGLSTFNSLILGGNENANSHKIINLTNGSASQDAVAFTQLSSGNAITAGGIANATITSTQVASNTITGSTANSGGSAGNISQGTVSTPDLRAHAVTTVTSGSAGVSAVSGTTIVSVSPTTEGFPLLIMYNVSVTLAGVAGASGVTTHVTVDGTEITGSVSFANGNSGGIPLTFPMSAHTIYTPAAGAHTVTLTYTLQPGSTFVGASTYTLSAIEMKR